MTSTTVSETTSTDTTVSETIFTDTIASEPTPATTTNTVTIPYRHLIELVSGSKKTQISKLLAIFGRGENLTVHRARTRYGISNLRARVSELRKMNVPVVTKQRRLPDGTVRHVYSLAA